MGDGDSYVVQAVPGPRTKPDASVLRSFEKFFRDNYRELIKTARYAGATRHEAQDAASSTLEEVLRRWDELDEPLRYARRAVVTNLIREKTRGLDRIRKRQVERGAGASEGCVDPNLTVWEDMQWVTQMLESLTHRQSEVLAYIVDDFTPTEIAGLLGSTPEAVRQRLCAARRRLQQELRQKRDGSAEQRRAINSSRREGR